MTKLTEYLYQADYIKSRVADHRARLEQREPGRRLEDKAVEVIWQRLLAEPSRYVEFGPWWWGVKQALANMGKSIGPDTDPLLLATYQIKRADGTLDIAGTIAAGEEFREMYQGTFFRGTRTFNLGPGAESYSLADDDLELLLSGPRRIGKTAAVV